MLRSYSSQQKLRMCGMVALVLLLLLYVTLPDDVRDSSPRIRGRSINTPPPPPPPPPPHLPPRQAQDRVVSHAFVPTHEWQAVKDGQVPPGLHIKIDLQTGEKMARLMDVRARSERVLVPALCVVVRIAGCCIALRTKLCIY